MEMKPNKNFDVARAFNDISIKAEQINALAAVTQIMCESSIRKCGEYEQQEKYMWLGVDFDAIYKNQFSHFLALIQDLSFSINEMADNGEREDMLSHINKEVEK